MENLIPTINRLQDVFTAVGVSVSQIDLPQIVVVGSQSAGKSSVIEAIVGRDFLPRGTGIVTRRPLILQLRHVPLDAAETRQGIKGDFAKFAHLDSTVFEDFEQVRTEIEHETERLTGTNKIFSHRVVNLTLVDLPGLTRIPVGDQPSDIEDIIHSMIMTYITNPNAIILAVTPANQDITTSEPIKFARAVDPDGLRTLAVLTKVDLMDFGTDAMEVLKGNVIKVTRGIIGVADITSKKAIEVAVRDEELFFAKKYPTIAARQGTKYLAHTLSRMLISHIQKCLPQLKYQVQTMLSDAEAKMGKFSTPVEDESKVLITLLNKFTAAYTNSIDGNVQSIVSGELSGGARIAHIFNEVFSNTINNINPMQGLTKSDVLTAIRNATGTRQTLFVPEIAFELLVKHQIGLLREPSKLCVDLVYDELVRIISCCTAELEEKRRFPFLFKRVEEAMKHLLDSYRGPAYALVNDLVDLEISYINTRRPEFSSAHFASFFQPSQMAFANDANAADSDYEFSAHPNDSANSEPHSLFVKADPADSSTDVAQTTAPDSSSRNAAFGLNGEHGGYFNFDEPRRVVCLQTPKEENDCSLIEHLICKYFVIVRYTLKESVPKAVMLRLVNLVKAELGPYLLSTLATRESNNALLAEDEDYVQRRCELMTMIQTLKKALDIIGEVREAAYF